MLFLAAAGFAPRTPIALTTRLAASRPILCAADRAKPVTSKPVRLDVGLVEQVSGLVRGDLAVQTIETDDDVDSPAIGLCVVARPDECTEVVPAEAVQRAKVGSYFGLWFALSVGYAVFNKRATNALPLPWLVGTSTVLVGSIFVQALWMTGIRTPPRLSGKALRTLLPIGAFHAIGHLAGTIGTTYGSVSFAQVVKAAGPVYACALSALVLRQAVSLRVWLSLLPIIGGVALATMKELSFAWGALIGAVVSDLALALRNVLSKQSMGRTAEERGYDMDPANMFGVLTVLSTAVSLPIALAVEGHAAPAVWAAAVQTAPGGAPGLLATIAAAGLFFYGYSEVAMQALANVHPVTHAIGNTLRRVVIMIVCMLVFQTPMTALGAAGSSLAIVGAFLYAMTRHREKLAEKAKAAEEAEALLAEAEQGAPDWGDPCDAWAVSAECILGPLTPPFLRPAPPASAGGFI